MTAINSLGKDFPPRLLRGIRCTEAIYPLGRGQIQLLLSRRHATLRRCRSVALERAAGDATYILCCHDFYVVPNKFDLRNSAARANGRARERSAPLFRFHTVTSCSSSPINVQGRKASQYCLLCFQSCFSFRRVRAHR